MAAAVPEDDGQHGDDLGQEAGAGHRQLPGRQVAAERDDERAEGDEARARHVVGAEDHLVFLLTVLLCPIASHALTRCGLST
jgi:hypothetical protein